MRHASGIDLAVCILFYEKLEQTIECISSFLPSGVPLYVLNNGSSRPARKGLQEFCAQYGQVRIIDSDVNLGVGVGRNRIISESTEAWLLFVDNDITIRTHDWVERIRQHREHDRAVEAFIPRVYSVDEKCYLTFHAFTLAGKEVKFKDSTGGETNSFPGGASFVNRRLFERLGLYDQQMFVGVEDYEFAIRGIMKGEPVRAKVIGDIELYHDHRRIKQEGDRKAVLARYNIGSIERSFERIKEKHGVTLQSKWKIWAFIQSKKMVQRDSALSKMVDKGIIYFFQKAALLNFLRVFLLNSIALLRKRSAPRSCTLYMTDLCNLKCGSCSRQTTGVRTVGEMTLDTVQRVVSLYPSVNSYCVAGFGEPTLCSDFVRIVDFLKMKKKYVGIITNGTNLDKLLSLQFDPDYISISLYGFNNESYAAYCGVPAFDKVASNFTILRERYKNVGFSYIMSRETYTSLDKILSLCESLNPRFVHLLNYLVYDPMSEEENRKIITVKDKDIIRRIDELCENRKYVTLKPSYVDLDNPKLHCNSYNDVINLDGEGNIGGCQRKIQPDPRFGNIFKEEDPFNSPEMRRLRDKPKTGCYAHDECKTCFAHWAK